MKTKNFPEKRRQRQLFVLENLLKIPVEKRTKQQIHTITVLEVRTYNNFRNYHYKKFGTKTGRMSAHS